MKTLTPSLVATVRTGLKGSRLAKFEASVAVINDSLAQGAWVPRGSVKASAGFYQGLVGKIGGRARELSDDRHTAFAFEMCFKYGHCVTVAELAAVAGRLTPIELAWAQLCTEAHQATVELDASRPAPRITAIGLSPRVTATLTEMGLDIDLPTIKLAKIDFYEVPALEKDGSPKFHRDGTPVMVRVYYVSWSKGIRHGMSRFAGRGCNCEACGKRIPSGRFVPVEATCRKHGLVSFWLGCDCAANIFGIKDEGIDPNAKAPEAAKVAS